MRIGVDIGGTKISGALIEETGTVHSRFRLASKSFSSSGEMAREIGQQITELLDRAGLHKSEIRHFGVGIPGTADWKNGVVIYSNNLLGENVPLGDELEAALGIRPTIVQDSWAGAYAEYRFGQHQKYPNMACVTLGTGIGCGIISDGMVYGGPMGTAGEIGHVVIERNGRPCSCGNRGCLEAYASGTGIWKQALELFPEKLQDGPQGAEAVFALAEKGDAQAQALLNQCVERLAFGLAILLNITACGNLFISGGLSCHEETFIAPLAEAIRSFGYPSWSQRVTPLVQRAALGADAPLIGAAFLEPEQIR